MKKINKIFCIGFSKTGTTSIGKALEILGYKKYQRDIPIMDYIKKENYKKLFNIVEQNDAFEDMPWALVYKKVDKQFPNSKFILTVRDKNRWINSMIKHFWKKKKKNSKWIYGKDNPIGNEKIYTKVYENHIKEVKNYFKERKNDLLVLNLKEKNKWKKICEFLGKEIPKIEFPHKNKTNTILKLKRTFGRNKIINKLKKKVENLKQKIS